VTACWCSRICRNEDRSVRTRRDQAEHQRSAGAQLELADRRLGGAAELCQQLRGLLTPAVVLAGQESLQPRFAQAA